MGHRRVKSTCRELNSPGLPGKDAEETDHQASANRLEKQAYRPRSLAVVLTFSFRFSVRVVVLRYLSLDAE